jgi:D-glycero-alpha-D-manno-heptose-7-phosphate kinase
MPVDAVVAARFSFPEGTPAPERGVSRVVRSRAPLRLGLAGGGTDVSPFCDRFGGIVLNATIDRYCYTTIEERPGERSEFISSDRGTRASLGDEPSALPLHAAVYSRMCAEFNLGAPGLSFTTVAEAPPGSGLGSSSTLVVSLVEAFREFFSLPLSEYEVARLAYGIERLDCGLQGGRQDQYAATFGGFNSIEFYADERVIVDPLRPKPAIVREFEASLVLYHTGESRSSASIIAQQTAHIANDHIDRIQATLALKDEAIAMKEALLLGDFHRVAEVINHGWLAKRQLADGISTPRIERAFEVAMASGALAGKVSGAGGGGYILFVVEPNRRPGLIEALGRASEGTVEPAHFTSEGAVSWRLR